MEPSTTTPSWASLIRRAQKGDSQATLKLIRSFASLLRYEARLHTRQCLNAETEDALSTMTLLFLEFIDLFDKFDIPDEKIPGLFKKHLHDKRLDLQLRERRHCPDCYCVDYAGEMEANTEFSRQFPKELPHTLEDMARRQEIEDLRKAMLRLKPAERQVLDALFLKRQTQEVTARQLHCSPRYVRKLKERGLARLRLLLKHRYPERIK